MLMAKTCWVGSAMLDRPGFVPGRFGEPSALGEAHD